MTDTLAPADLAAYLARVGHHAATRPDLATLVDLHRAHVAAIPFENLDVRWGRGIALDVPALVAKLVQAGRGGYCFEQNGLFAAVLRTIGFEVRPLAARVRYRATRVLPRTHQLLLVDVEGERYVADVGFGAHTLLEPVPLAADRVFAQHAWRYALRDEGETWVLRLAQDAAWTELYAFTLEPQFPPDAEMANWYVSTHPQSRFVQTMTVQRATPGARHVVQNDEYSVDSGHGEPTVRRIGHDELVALLRSEFGLALPPGTRLPLP